MKIRYIVTVIVVLFLGLYQVNAQNKLIEKYEDMDDVTSVYISPKMFALFANSDNSPNFMGDSKEVNLEKLKGKIKSLAILTTDKSDIVKQMRGDVSSMLDKGEYQEIMRVKDGGDRVYFYIKQNGETINEILMTVQDSSYTLITVTGSFTMSDLENFVQ